MVFLDVPEASFDGTLEADTKVCNESMEASMAGGGAALEACHLLQTTTTDVVYIVSRNPGKPLVPQLEHVPQLHTP